MFPNQRRKWLSTSQVDLFLLFRIGVALLALWLSNAFFHICNAHMFPVEGFSAWMGLIWANVVFGLVSVAVVLLPYIVLVLLPKLYARKWYRVVCEALYYLPILAMVVAKCIDSQYFPFTYRLMSSEMFAYLGIGGDMGNLTKYFIRDYWVAGVGIVVAGGVLILLGTKSELQLKGRSRWNGWAALVLGVLVVVMRVSIGSNTMDPKSVARFVEPKYSPIVINSGYNILHTALSEQLSEADYMSEAEAQSIFNPEYASCARCGVDLFPSTAWGEGGSYVKADSSLGYRNVVVLMMESFSQEYMGCYNNGLMPSRTPFLDSLAQHSIVYQGRSNGKKSIESIAAVTASVPTLMEVPFAMSKYADNDLNSLPQILSKYGFTSTFYHGGYNGTMAFDKFCQKVGFDGYVGMDEYLADGGDPKGYDNAWGISDEPFLQYAVKKMGETKEPFFNFLFTISSHHPYGIPEEHKGEFAPGVKPLLPCVEYTDMALRKFFAEARKTDWYKNTLFVILADHPGNCIDSSFNNYHGWYRIPMMFYSPAVEVHTESSDIVQQIDLMPTIVDYLGLNERFVCFGNSVFHRNADNQGYQVVYGNGWHALNYVGGTALIEGSTEIGDPQHLQLLKAIVQQYNHRVRTNQLVVADK